MLCNVYTNIHYTMFEIMLTPHQSKKFQTICSEIRPEIEIQTSYEKFSVNKSVNFSHLNITGTVLNSAYLIYRQFHTILNVFSASFFPCSTKPSVPINAKKTWTIVLIFPKNIAFLHLSHKLLIFVLRIRPNSVE